MAAGSIPRTEVAIRTRAAVKIPDLLYRYRSLDPAFAERELDALRGAYVWSPRFGQMNDPMEAFYEMGGVADPMIDHLLKRQGKSTADFYDLAKRTIDNFCLVSFSSSPNDLPMWAYYGGNFAGMCLEFDTADLFVGDFQNERILPVTYAAEPLPPIGLHEVGAQEAIEARLSRKRVEWQHEKEWRILTGAEGAKHYLDDALVRIYLGPRVSDAHADTICAIFKDRPTEILRGRIRGYELTFDTVSTATPISLCGRVGAGVLNLDDMLLFRDELEGFLTVPLDDLIGVWKAQIARPNAEEISGCDLSGSHNKEALYLWTQYRLRSDRIVWERRYYDRQLQRIAESAS